MRRADRRPTTDGPTDRPAARRHAPTAAALLRRCSSLARPPPPPSPVARLRRLRTATRNMRLRLAQNHRQPDVTLPTHARLSLSAFLSALCLSASLCARSLSRSFLQHRLDRRSLRCGGQARRGNGNTVRMRAHLVYVRLHVIFVSLVLVWRCCVRRRCADALRCILFTTLTPTLCCSCTLCHV